MKAGTAVLAVAATLGLAGPANAALVTKIGDDVSYVALSGEVNHVVVTPEDGAVLVQDLSPTLLIAGPGCATAGTDSVRCVSATDVRLDLGDANDVVAVHGRLHAELIGGPGDDVLSGGALSDALSGGDGNDLLNGGGGGDSMDGGAGEDLAYYEDRVAALFISLDVTANDGEPGEGDLILSVEHVSGGAGDDVLVGDEGPNRLLGGPGNDSLAGYAGIDQIDGGPGRDGVNALDPSAQPDVVACGAGGDRVYGDVADTVGQDCETVDRSGVLGYTARATAGPEEPELGRSIVLKPISGIVLVTPPPAGAAPDAPQPVPALPPVPLDAERNIPVGSVVDTRFGLVELSAAIDGTGAVQKGLFTAGAFQVFQEAVAGAIVDLPLRGGKSFAGCPAGQQGPGVARAAARKGRGAKVIRRLWADAHGNFRSRGRFASATVRGTNWLTEDRCEGTLVRVRRGAVAVRDLRSGSTRLVRAGQRHLVRAQG